jgi:hypothetical protein
MSLELNIFLSLWGHTERACIMIIYSLHSCIVPPLINYLSYFVTKSITKHLFSQKLQPLLQMSDYYQPIGNEAFLGIFGTPTFALEGAKFCEVHRATTILLGTEAHIWRAMVWGEDVHSNLYECTIVSRMESRFRRENPLGRRLGDSFWGSWQALLAAWWCTYQ